MIAWVRRRVLTGFFVTVPLVVSVAALVWLFRLIDGFVAPLAARIVGRAVPGLGLVTMTLALLVVGVLATNVFGKRLLQVGEQWLLKLPLFRTIYAPLKQLVLAFSPDNEYGFKRVVLIESPQRGMALGFLTREFLLDRGGGPVPMVAVYVPTNHLYLGDIVVVPREQAVFPDLSVEEALRIFLTGGMALADRVTTLLDRERGGPARLEAVSAATQPAAPPGRPLTR
jgi:uncharacterized membrane protein